jgi:cytochrome c-type biogenesis protein CcmH/NrfG
VETALRSLVGGSALAGQALIGELRQRELLSINQAHALLEYLAARDRSGRAEYRPTAADVAAVRTGFQTLEAALGVGIGAKTGTYPAIEVPSAGPMSTPGSTSAPGVGESTAAWPRRRGVSPLALGIVATVLLVVIAGAVYAYNERQKGPRAAKAGAAAYTAGRREEARTQFAEAVRRSPRDPLPHVFLARLAREDGDVAAATRELQTAISLDSANSTALREMGNLQLAANNPALAIRFYRRAVAADPEDRASAGWLGCALVRTGQQDVAARFFARAGVGDWSACARAASGQYGPPPMPGAPMPGVAPQGAQPAPYRP